MKDYLVAIINRIKETAQYNSMSYHAIVESAVEVESIEDLDDRKIARKKFRKYNDLTSQVWAKIPARFPNYKECKRDVIRSLSYMCQLPKAECWDLYIAHKDHLDETNAHLRVRDDVDMILDAKRKPYKLRAKKDKPDCPRCKILDEFIAHRDFVHVDELQAALAARDG